MPDQVELLAYQHKYPFISLVRSYDWSLEVHVAAVERRFFVVVVPGLGDAGSIWSEICIFQTRDAGAFFEVGKSHALDAR